MSRTIGDLVAAIEKHIREEWHGRPVGDRRRAAGSAKKRILPCIAPAA